MKPERRTVQEQLGSSFNASVLRSGRPDVETPLTRVAALGAAALHIHHGADRARLPVATVLVTAGAKPDPRDVLAAQLSSMLAHIRYGGQYSQVGEAVEVFAQWMGHRARFNAYPDRACLLPKLAARVLHEWLSDRCTRCGGSGRLEVTRDGALVRGRGLMQRNAAFRACPVHQGCGGSGRSMPSHTARRLALEIPYERYEKERWAVHFNAAMAWLSMHLSPRINRPLTEQLERSKKRV